MDNRLVFNDLETTVKFLSKILFNPMHTLRPDYYHLHYLLQGRVTLETGGRVGVIHFSGTNHSTDENERLFLDQLLSGVSYNDLVLVEDGEGYNSYCENNMVDDLKGKISDDQIVEGVNPRVLFDHNFGELTYATDLARAKGARVKNMDMNSNPEALKIIIDRYGNELVIRRLKMWLGNYFETPQGLERYIQNLLSNSGIIVGAEEISKQKPFDPLEEAPMPSYRDREDYMTNEILKELRNPLYVVAHTMHVKEILKRLNRKAKILDFSATLTNNTARYNWATATEKDIPPYERGRYIRQKLAIYRLTNRLLSRDT